MRSFLFLPLLTCLVLICPGCIFSTESIPEWMAHRPIHPQFLYGVGTCGKTRTLERARTLAMERAVWEICAQAHARFDYEIEFKEEAEDGTQTLDVRTGGGRLIHTLSGVQVVDEAFFERSRSGFTQDTVVLLVRIPRPALRW